MTPERRKQHNRELVERMRAGEKLSSFSSQASFFPPRPLVKKSTEDLLRLFGPGESPRIPSKESESL